ncbi:MAG: hypothetical protein ACE5HQ_13370 [Gemmatimonadota bacterium]
MSVDVLLATIGLVNALASSGGSGNPVANRADLAARSPGVPAIAVSLRSSTIRSTSYKPIPASYKPIPAFARREHMACSVCHTSIPRLTRFGYEYRNAGFRIPAQIGKSRPVDIPNMISARTQSLVSVTHTKNEATSTTSNKRVMKFKEFTIYPATGSFGRYWSAFAEFSTSPEDFFEIENAYVRATVGNEKDHFQIRAGVFHPFEGYGASDRPAGLSRPLFQRTPANNAGTSTFFTLWGFDQMAVEAGFTHKGFNAAAAVLNGIYVNPEERKAFPFQGGELNRSGNDPNFNSKDIQVFLNQFIPVGGADAAISAYYYHGTLSVPYDFETPASYTDSFDRVAAYGTLPVTVSADKALWLLGGVAWGQDRRVDATTGNVLPGKFKSGGWFGELYMPASQYVGMSARYDFFRPSRDQDDNALKAFTLGANLAALDGMQAILEYQYKDVQTGRRPRP